MYSLVVTRNHSKDPTNRLGNLEYETCVQNLIQLLIDKNSVIRGMALEVLKFLARYKGEDRLVKLVNEEIGIVCPSGVQALQARL